MNTFLHLDFLSKVTFQIRICQNGILTKPYKTLVTNDIIANHVCHLSFDYLIIVGSVRYDTFALSE